MNAADKSPAAGFKRGGKAFVSAQLTWTKVVQLNSKRLSSVAALYLCFLTRLRSRSCALIRIIACCCCTVPFGKTLSPEQQSEDLNLLWSFEMLSVVHGLLQRGLPLALARGVLASNVAALRAFSSKTAKALVIDEFGKPEDVLRLEHTPIREPGEGEVRPPSRHFPRRSLRASFGAMKTPNGADEPVTATFAFACRSSSTSWRWVVSRRF